VLFRSYSAVYGIGKAGLARSTGMSVKEAEFLLEAYWERNWAVKAVAKDVYKKETKDGKMWLKNPVSGFWYSLRYEKDSWSTLNQGTGVYCFDKFLHILRSKGVKLLGNFHDEFISVVERGKESSMDETIKSSVSKLNYQIQLNVRLDVDYSYGDSYAEIH
jgi:DNA polymerase I-like protein with 3'-5' exonuclease and polymerase domains